MLLLAKSSMRRKWDESNFPEEAAGWGAADFIIIDEYPLADLSEKKQECVVRMGSFRRHLSNWRF